MKISEMILNLEKILKKNGDMDIILHDSSEGIDYDGMSVYMDMGDGDMPNECVIGFDGVNDMR